MADTTVTTEQQQEKLDFSKLTADQVKELLENNDAAKKLMQSITDAAVTKGIQTFEERTLPGRVKAELDKVNPKETVEQREMREMKEQMKILMGDKKKAELTAVALRRIQKEKLPEQFIDFVSLDQDEAFVSSQLDRLTEVFTGTLNQAVEDEVSKRTGRKPAEADKDIKNPLPYNPYDKATFNLTEQIKMEEEKPGVAAHLAKIAKT